MVRRRVRQVRWQHPRGASAPVVALLAALALAGPAHAVTLHKVGDFVDPVYVTSPPADGDRLFVVERGGRIRVARGGAVTTFLDISSLVRAGGEQGLLSMAFAPDYAASGRFYVYYTDPGGDIRIEEFARAAPDQADAGSRRTVLVQEHSQYPNHNGGQLQFGPDGYLYASLGDGGGAGDPLRAGQSLTTLLGKLIRIDPRPQAGAPYTVPGDNPLAGTARPEIWAYGLRNPWRFSFDRATGDLTVGDVGQGAWEEVDFAPAAAGRGRGANFGWSCFEGTRPYAARCPGATQAPPVLELSHSAGFCSITGGYVVRDPALTALFGRYLYADFCKPGLRSAVLAASGASDDREVGVSVPSASSFGEDACGRVYVASLEGPVYRLDEGQPSPCVVPAAGGQAAGPGSVAGSRAGAFRVRLRGARAQSLRRRWLTVAAVCERDCTLRASGRIAARGVRRVTLRHLRRQARAGSRTVLRWRIGRAERRRLLRALRRGRPVRAVVRVAAAGAGGERTTGAVRRFRIVP